MRLAVIVWLLGATACNSADPAWSLPCSQEPAASVEVGNGQSQYLPIGSAGVPIEVDATGTYVWLSISSTGLGQDISVSSGIDDASGHAVATLADQPVVQTFNDGTNRDEAAGLAAQFLDPATAVALIGTNVTVWADATGCGRTVKGTTPTTISGYDVTSCQGCLAEACQPQLAVCDADCFAIQGCLDVYCANLSADASPDEVTCQAYCESLHPKGKLALVALVSCVQGSACQPPCNGYSIDYDACVAAENLGACAGDLANCNGDPNCTVFKTCTSTCTTWAECEACGTPNPDGVKLFEQYETCLESTCLTLGWLPHLSD